MATSEEERFEALATAARFSNHTPIASPPPTQLRPKQRDLLTRWRQRQPCKRLTQVQPTQMDTPARRANPKRLLMFVTAAALGVVACSVASAMMTMAIAAPTPPPDGEQTASTFRKEGEQMCPAREFLIGPLPLDPTNTTHVEQPPFEPVLLDRRTGMPVEVASVDNRVVADRLVSRATNRTVQTSAADSLVLDGIFIDRASGEVIQTRPAIREIHLASGPFALLNMSVKDLQDVKTITLIRVPNSDDVSSKLTLESDDDEEEEEHYQVVGVKLLAGVALERVVVLQTASGDDILLFQSAIGSHAMSVLERSEWRAFQREIQADEHAGLVKTASLIARHVFCEEYLNETEADGEIQRRRLAVRRRLYIQWAWNAAGTAVGAVADAAGATVDAAAGYMAKIGKGVADATRWITSGAITAFTGAYDKIRNFVSMLNNLLADWKNTIQGWIKDKLDELGREMGSLTTATLKRLIYWLDDTLLKGVSMDNTSQNSFTQDTGSPWGVQTGFLIKRCVTGVQSNLHDVACQDVASWSRLLSSGFECVPPRLPQDMPEEPKIPWTLKDANVALCISLDRIVIDFPDFGTYLTCLVEKVPSFMATLFEAGAAAIEHIINTIKGWIANSIEWAIDKIQELWNGVKSVVDGIKSVLGRRLQGDGQGSVETRLDELADAIQVDQSLDSWDQLQLLDMVRKVKVVREDSQELLIHGRRRMAEEMMEQEAEHARRGRNLDEQGQGGETCAQRARPGPITISHGIIALSLPIKIEFEVTTHDLFELNKDILEEFGVKPRALPISVTRTLPIMPPFLHLKIGFSLDVSVPLRVLSSLFQEGDPVGGEDQVVKVVIISTGGLVEIDVSSTAGDDRVKVQELPSFEKSYIEVASGLNGSAAFSFGLHVDGHLEFGVGTLGSIFATAHAQFQWGAKVGFDLQVRGPPRRANEPNQIESFSLQLPDDVYALGSYGPGVMQKISGSSDCTPNANSAAVAVAAWGYVTKPRMRLDLVLQVFSSDLIGNSGLPLGQPHLTTAQRRAIIAKKKQMQRGRKAEREIAEQQGRMLTSMRGNLSKAPWNLLSADWKALHLWDFDGMNSNTDQLDFFFHDVSGSRFHMSLCAHAEPKACRRLHHARLYPRRPCAPT